MMSESLVPDATRRAPRDENNIAFLRLVLAVAVIWTHSFNVLGLADPVEVGLGTRMGTPSVQLMNMGVLAVNGFFVLSGYLISGSWARRRNWRGFLNSRARRLYPGWFVAIAVCLFIVAPLGSQNPGAVWHEIAVHPKRLLSSLWMVPPQFPLTLERVPLPRAVNSSLWTLAYEFRLYLLVPVVGTIWLWLCRRLSRRRVWWLPALVFALLYVFYCAQLAGLGLQTSLGFAAPHDPRYPVVPTQWPRLTTYFAAGACLYVYRAHFRASLGLTLGCLAVLVAARFVGVLPWALPIFGSGLLMSLALDARGRLPRIPADFDVSYGTYLYAFSIQQMLVFFGGTQRSGYGFFLFSTLCALLAGTASWLLVERPFLRFRR